MSVQFVGNGFDQVHAAEWSGRNVGLLRPGINKTRSYDLFVYIYNITTYLIDPDPGLGTTLARRAPNG